MPDPDSLALAAARPALPLQGLTILAVEDSRYACEALRLLAQRSGARLRRAGTLRDARRHLALYRPDAVIVDIGLPDGSGLALIRALRGVAGRGAAGGGPVVIATSGDAGARAAALEAGAADYLDKPVAGLAAFRTLLLRHLPGPPVATAEEGGPLRPDPLALREDLAMAAALLEAGPDAGQRAYLARFLGGIARSTRDAPLERAAGDLAGEGAAAALRRASGLVASRLRRSPAPFAAPGVTPPGATPPGG